MGSFRTSDGAEIYFKDWGEGPAVVFSHGWPLTADAWDPQLNLLASNGTVRSPTTGVEEVVLRKHGVVTTSAHTPTTWLG